MIKSFQFDAERRVILSGCRADDLNLLGLGMSLSSSAVCAPNGDIRGAMMILAWSVSPRTSTPPSDRAQVKHSHSEAAWQLWLS